MAYPLPTPDEFRYEGQDSFIHEALSLAPCRRLAQVGQLTYLQFNKLSMMRLPLFGFTHSRMTHTIDVVENLETIARKNHLTPSDTMMLKLGGLCHDQTTPACGDWTKPIAPDVLDEEQSWFMVLHDPTFREFMQRRMPDGRTFEEIDAIVRNRGVFGELLDIADRIAYVIRDCREVKRHGDELKPLDEYSPLREIATDEVDDIAEIINDVRIVDGQVCFTDIDLLYRFLKLRAYLHRDLYADPINRTFISVFSRLVHPLYLEGIVNQQKLITYDDPTLVEEMVAYYRKRFKQAIPREIDAEGFIEALIGFRIFSSWCSSEAQAHIHMSSLYQPSFTSHGRFVHLSTLHPLKFKTGSKYKILLADGSVASFAELLPQLARHLEEIAGNSDDAGVMLNIGYHDRNSPNAILSILEKLQT